MSLKGLRSPLLCDDCEYEDESCELDIGTFWPPPLDCDAGSTDPFKLLVLLLEAGVIKRVERRFVDSNELDVRKPEDALVAPAKESRRAFLRSCAANGVLWVSVIDASGIVMFVFRRVLMFRGTCRVTCARSFLVGLAQKIFARGKDLRLLMGRCAYFRSASGEAKKWKGARQRGPFCKDIWHPGVTFRPFKNTF